MILHMGGVFGDKAATLDRFRTNYLALPEGVKKRLVLENDDVSWSVHELLPICQELNIPLVLDYHHNNIIHSDDIREGTLDIMDLYDDIKATWTRKGITQKMHYSEPTPPAVTGRQRRKHSPRVATLPSCAPDMDLMIEAKDKEQAVFELMRAFKLPGFEKVNDIIPHVRIDENRPEKKRATPKKKKTAPAPTTDAEPQEEEEELVEDVVAAMLREHVPEEEVSMGGPDGRVYWPPGMEEWLRPVKRVVKKKEKPEAGETPASKKRKGTTNGVNGATILKEENEAPKGPAASAKQAKVPPKKATRRKRRGATPSVTSSEDEGSVASDLRDAVKVDPGAPRRTSGRAKKVP
jgi:UV DNA damage endonuclease